MTTTATTSSKTISMKTPREQEHQQQLDDAQAHIARLENQTPQVVVLAPEKTPYERFVADGGTQRDWRRRQRRIAHMQNHY